MPRRDENQTLLSEKETTVFSNRFVPERAPVATIMFAQVLFCVLAWVFAGFMMHETIPLSDSRAAWVQNNPSNTQVIVTLISTILALIGSSLLGKAVEYALIHRLSYAPLPLHTMLDWTKLAQRTVSFNFDERRLSWAIISIAYVGLLGFLTTVWSALLAPENVVIYLNFQDNETDFLDPSISTVVAKAGAQPPPGFNLTPTGTADWIRTHLGDQMGTNLAAALIDAGFSLASVKQYSAFPTASNSFINLPGPLYLSNISTGGIYPTGRQLSIPPSSGYIDIGNPWYQGLSRTYDATQRGFTADVSCRPFTPDDPVITLSLTHSIQMLAGDNDTWVMNTYSWNTNCSSEVEYSTFGVTIVNTMLPDYYDPLLATSVCFGQGFSGSSNQSFMVLLFAPSDSVYAALSQICQVTPLVTTVQTTYDQTNIINIPQPPLEQHPLPNPTTDNGTSTLLWFPAYAIWTVFVQSQGLTTNTVGDRLLAYGQTDYGSVTEDCFRGMLEYLGSLLAGLAWPLSESTPVTVPFNGTVIMRTFGWTFHAHTHGPSLAVITLVTLLTVSIGFFALVLPTNASDGTSQSQTHKRQAKPAQTFTPTSMIDVLLASSTGNLSTVLSKSGSTYRPANDDHKIGGKDDEENRCTADERLRVVLGMTNEGWPTLRAVSVNEIGVDNEVDHGGSTMHSNSIAAGLGGDDGRRLSVDVAGRDEDVICG